MAKWLLILMLITSPCYGEQYMFFDDLYVKADIEQFHKELDLIYRDRMNLYMRWFFPLDFEQSVIYSYPQIRFGEEADR